MNYLIAFLFLFIVFGNTQEDEGFLGDFFEQFPLAPFGRVRYPKSYFSSLNYNQPEDSEAHEAIHRPSPGRSKKYSEAVRRWKFERPHKYLEEHSDEDRYYIKSLPRRRPPSPYGYENSPPSHQGGYHHQFVTESPVYVSTLAPHLRSEVSFAHVPGPPYHKYYYDEPLELPHSNFWPNDVESSIDDKEPSFIESYEKVRTRINNYNFRKKNHSRGRKKYRRRRPSSPKVPPPATKRPFTTTQTTTISIVVSTLPPRPQPAIKFVDRTPSSIFVNNRAHPRIVTQPLITAEEPRSEKLEASPENTGSSNSTTEDIDTENVKAAEDDDNDESVTLKHVEQLLIAILDHQQNQSRLMVEPPTPVPVMPPQIRRRLNPLVSNFRRNPVVRGAFGVLSTKAKGLGNVLFPNRRPRANQTDNKQQDAPKEGDDREESEMILSKDVKMKEKLNMV